MSLVVGQLDVIRTVLRSTLRVDSVTSAVTNLQVELICKSFFCTTADLVTEISNLCTGVKNNQNSHPVKKKTKKWQVEG